MVCSAWKEGDRGREGGRGREREGEGGREGGRERERGRENGSEEEGEGRIREKSKHGYQFMYLSHLPLHISPSHPPTLSRPHSLTFSNSTSTIVPPFIFRISTGVVFGLGCGLGFIKSIDNPEVSTDRRDMLS